MSDDIQIRAVTVEMLRNIGATLSSESRITLNGKYPGRELQGDIPKSKGIVRAMRAAEAAVRSWDNSSTP